MIYLLYGTEKDLITEYISSIKKGENIDTVNKFEFSSEIFDDVVNDLRYNDMFNEKKIVILSDTIFLTSSSSLENNEFSNYINNPNLNNILIITVYSEKLDERKKIVKLLQEKAKVQIFNKLNDIGLINKVKDKFLSENYNIEINDIKFLINRCNIELSIINNEIKKLKLFKIDDKTITKDDIINVVSEYSNVDIFKLIDAVKEKNKKKIFSEYKMIKQNIDDFQIIVLLSNEFRLLLQIKLMNSSNYKFSEIASELGIHPYRVKLGLNNINNFTVEYLENILLELGKIDKVIKTNSMNTENILFDFFLGL